MKSTITIEVEHDSGLDVIKAAAAGGLSAVNASALFNSARQMTKSGRSALGG